MQTQANQGTDVSDQQLVNVIASGYEWICPRCESTVLVTARVVLLYATDRFHVARVHISAALPAWQPLVGLARRVLVCP